MTNETTAQRTYRIEQIDPHDLTSTDLLDEVAIADDTAHGGEAPLPCQAYRITIYDAAGLVSEPETAEALTVHEGRTGIAWGAPASWADSLGDIEQDIECWLNDGEAWHDRN